jgi:hypothetical protein
MKVPNMLMITLTPIVTVTKATMIISLLDVRARDVSTVPADSVYDDGLTDFLAA